MRMMIGGKVLTAGLLLLATAGMGQNQGTPPQSTPPQGAPPSAPQGAEPANNPPATPPGPQNEAAPAPAAVSSQKEATGAAPLRVMVGKSLLINVTERLKRVSVTDDAVADAIVVTPTQILVHGKSPGEVSLLIWDLAERSRSFDLRVDVDITAAAEEEHRVFPDEQINVSPSRNAIVLSGHVSTEDVAKRGGMIAEAYSKSVVNVLTFGPQGSQEVLLEVKFAEVDRTALTQLGANIFSTGALGTLGNFTTGQFSGPKFGNLSDTSPAPSGTPITSNVSISDALNIFLFRPDTH